MDKNPQGGNTLFQTAYGGMLRGTVIGREPGKRGTIMEDCRFIVPAGNPLF
jgi:hypothetical protein